MVAVAELLDRAKKTPDIEKVLDAIKATEGSAPTAIGGAGERSSYQFMKPTFYGVQKQDPTLPKIAFEDLSKEENDGIARAYARSLVTGFVSQGHTDPKDIAAKYNSGKPLAAAPSITKRNYVPRFLNFLAGAGVGEARAQETAEPKGVSVQSLLTKPRGGAGVPVEDLFREMEIARASDAAMGFASVNDILAALEENGVIESGAEFDEFERQNIFEAFHAGLDDPVKGALLESFPARALQRGFHEPAIGLTRWMLGHAPEDDPRRRELEAQAVQRGRIGNEAYLLGSQVARARANMGTKFAAGGARILPDLPLFGTKLLRALPAGTKLPALFGATELLRPGADFESLSDALKSGFITEVTFGGAGRLGRVAAPNSRLAQIFAQGGAGGLLAGAEGGNASDVGANIMLGSVFGLQSQKKPGLDVLSLGERAKSLLDPRVALEPLLMGKIETPLFRRVRDARDRFVLAKMEKENEAQLAAADAVGRMFQGPTAGAGVEGGMRAVGETPPVRALRNTPAEDAGFVTNPDWVKASVYGEQTPTESGDVRVVRGGATRQSLHEKTLPELEAELEAAKVRDEADLVELFGQAGAQRYKRLLRRENSMDPNISDDASRERQNMEDLLTSSEQNRLYGIGDERPQVDELRAFRDEVAHVEGARTAEDVAFEMQWTLPKLPAPEKSPVEWTYDERVAVAKMNAARRVIEREGLDSAEVTGLSLQATSARFPDPADSAFILSRFMEPSRAVETPTPGLLGLPRGPQTDPEVVTKPATGRRAEELYTHKEHDPVEAAREMDELMVLAEREIEAHAAKALGIGLQRAAGVEPELKHPVDVVEERVGDRIHRKAEEIIAAAERGGTLPRGFTETVRGFRAKDKITAAMIADGRLPVQAKDVKNALLPPAGMHNFGIEAFNEMSKADRTVILDLMPQYIDQVISPDPAYREGDGGLVPRQVGSTGRFAGTPDVILARDHRTMKIFWALDRGVEPAKKFMWGRWSRVLYESMTVPKMKGAEVPEQGLGVISDLFAGHRLFEARRPRPKEDRQIVGRWLDGQAAAIEAMKSRPDLLKQAENLRVMLDEVADWAGLPPGMKLSEYFPHMMRVAAEFAFDIPFVVEGLDADTARTFNLTLREHLGGLRKSELVAIRDHISKGRPLPARLKPRANIVKAVLDDVATAANKRPKHFAGEYFNMILRNAVADPSLIDVATDISAMVPKRLFHPNLDKKRQVLNPEFLEFDALDVLRVYLYGASRKIAWDRMGGHEIHSTLKDLKSQFPNNTLVKYVDDYLVNYLGRNKTEFNARMEEWLRERKSIQYLSKKDLPILTNMAKTLMAPLPVTRFSNLARQIEFNAKIGGNIVTPFVNLTQPLFLAAPILSTNRAGKHIPGLGEARLLKAALWFMLPKFRGIRKDAIADGVFGDPTKFELADTTFDAIPMTLMGSLGRGTLQALGLAFRGSEWNNRGLVYTAGYMTRWGDLKPEFEAGRVTMGERRTLSREFARELTNNTQFRGGKVSQALGFQRPTIAPFTQFKSFNVKTAELYWNKMSRAEKIHTVALMLIIAGPGGIPILNRMDPNDEWPSLAQAAGLDLTNYFGISMFGVPRMDPMDIAQFMLGPFPGDVVRVGQGMVSQTEPVDKTLEALFRFAPASAQINRARREESEGLATFLGPSITLD